MPRLNLVYGSAIGPPVPPACAPGSPDVRGENGARDVRRVRRDLRPPRTGRNGERGAKGGAEKAERPEPEALAELDRLVGLDQVKRLIREIYAYVAVGQWRSREKLASEPTVLHMVFCGNPGTGKTTVARLLGRLFKELGVLSRGHLLEVERADLVGEYIGHTAQRTREQVKKALGGILFVDEAYSLARGGDKDFGREAVDTLVRAMEHHRNEFVLVLAGYRREMEWFLRTNPGLRSRLPLQLDFPDYTAAELFAIAEYLLAERDYFLSPGAAGYLERRLRQLVLEGKAAQGNARLVRNLLERAMRRQAVRLLRQGAATREELMRLETVDFLEEKEKARGDLALDFTFETEERTPLEA